MSGLKTSYVNIDSLYSAMGNREGLSDAVSDFQTVTGVEFANKNQPADALMGGSGAANRRSRFGDNEDASPVCPSLSFRNRLIGFLICAGVGVLFGIFSWITAFTKGGGTFAVIYTFSNLFLVGSTLFLCGPLRQAKNMVRPTRLIATIVFVVAMILTFVFALGVKIAGLTILTVIVQYLAMAWYALSYIPFARDAVRACLPCGR